MHREFLLLGLFPLALALPNNKRPVQTGSEESTEWDPSATSSSKTFDPTSTTTPSATSTTFSITTTTSEAPMTTTLSTTTTTSEAPITTTLSTTTTISDATMPIIISEAPMTTHKPESKVINIKKATELKTRVSKAGDSLVIVFVMVTWCGSSSRAVPTVEEIARTRDDIIVLKVDWDEIDKSEHWDYGVTDVIGYPTFVFIKNGKVLLKYADANSNRLRRRIKEFTNSDV